MDAYLDKTVKSASTLLGRWVDANVLVRQLPVAPRFLEVVLFRSADEVRDSNLCLYFDPLWFEGAFSWSDSRMQVRAVPAASSLVASRTSYESVLELSDEASRFRCLTESLEVKENVRLK